MKKIAVAATLLVGVLVAEGYGQERAHTAPGKPVASQHRTGEGRAAVSRTDRGKPAFSGRIIEVNVDSATLRVKGSDATVTFDASNPMFSGYRGLSDVRTGDRVAVSYTADGIRVTRLGGKAEQAEKVGPPGPPAAPPPSVTSPEKRSKESKKLTRIRKKGNGEGFDDVDVNKDGRIAPVELSVVVPDITMDLFRQYDKNRNGCLDKPEFTEALKQRRAAKGE